MTAADRGEVEEAREGGRVRWTGGRKKPDRIRAREAERSESDGVRREEINARRAAEQSRCFPHKQLSAFFPGENRSAVASTLSWKLAPIQSEARRSPMTLLTSSACWGQRKWRGSHAVDVIW